MPTIMNAANEIMVAAFLNNEIGFNDIASYVEEICELFEKEGAARTPADLETALAVDHIVRERSRARLAGPWPLGGDAAW